MAGRRRRARDRDADARPRPSLLLVAAQAGLPAFCEKPVALDLATLDAVDRRGRAGRHPRAGRVPAALRCRLPRGARCRRRRLARQAPRAARSRRTTRRRRPRPTSRRSGGIFRDLHIHDFDALRFVTGEEIVEVYADGAVRESPWFADHGDVDVAVAVLRLERRRARHPLGNPARSARLRRPARGLRHRRQHRRRTRRAQPDPLARAGRGDGSRSRATATSWSDSSQAYRDELAAFVATVRSDGPAAPARSREARAAMHVALAADRSRRERRPVAIDEIARALSHRRLTQPARQTRQRKQAWESQERDDTRRTRSRSGSRAAACSSRGDCSRPA